MRKITQRILVSAAVLLCVPGLPFAQQDINTPKPPNSVTFSGDDTTVGLESEGNIIQYESPSGYEHIGVGAFSEGYIVCYSPPGLGEINANDVTPFGPGQGFGPPAFVPGGNFVTRITLDGFVRLHQVFSFEPSTRALTITMKVQNLSAVTLGGVIVRRQVDFDIDTGGSLGWAGFLNNHANSKDSVFAWNSPARAPSGLEAHQMELAHLLGPSDHSAKVTPGILDTDCNPPSIADSGPRINEDRGDTLQYNIGSLPPGQATTIRVRYSRS
jgi:hypothetical protein